MEPRPYCERGGRNSGPVVAPVARPTVEAAPTKGCRNVPFRGRRKVRLRRKFR